MTVKELRAKGFDIFSFHSEKGRQDFKNELAKSGVEWELVDSEEEIAHTRVLFLGRKRLSPTLKQQLQHGPRTGFPRGD